MGLVGQPLIYMTEWWCVQGSEYVCVGGAQNAGSGFPGENGGSTGIPPHPRF